MSRLSLLTLAALLVSSTAFAQGAPGDATFCRQYADTVATAAEDAIRSNPACLDPGRGVHGDRDMHRQWCARTPQDQVEGASVHVRRLAARCGALLVAPQEYGGYAIVGDGQMEEPYGRARQWQVSAAFSGRLFMYCVAETRIGDSTVRIGVDRAMPGDGSQWQLAVPVKSNPNWQGRLEIDGSEPAGRAGADVSGTAVFDWTIAWLNMGQVDALRNGGQAAMGVGRADFAFSLQGIAAAITKVEECRQRLGRATPASAPAAPQVQGRPQPVAPAQRQAQAQAPRQPAVVNAPTIFALRSNTGLCVRHVGGNGPGASDLVLSPCDAATTFNFVSTGDAIRLWQRHGTCASVNRMPEPPEEVMMISCRDTQDRWRFNEGTGQIRNGDNYCWTVDRAPRPGAKIVGTPCRPNAANQRFDVQT
ncbi:ricin-type beta-trefoil lectin domain protein [Phreatobacter sp.]|uniref:ricin-type beta-trefoil lectin domain protein n=1 Tax=Phreatobacter sp. TaxID=1966341 RepID=UPI003F6F1CD0